jgi:DNA repair exonuclease SbcCD ATPase subunit
MNSKGFVEWFIKSGSNTTYLNKISGYQKFALNLAIRIVFSRIGQIKLEQMFIDEGFSCCDEKNLSEIPDFLNRLLNIYRSITIVSHLNELKDYFHNKITIRKDVHEGFSVLVKN